MQPLAFDPAFNLTRLCGLQVREERQRKIRLMRLNRDKNGETRQSALWGKPSKGETRSSALWGKPGRGFAILALVAALAAPVAATAGQAGRSVQAARALVPA